MTKLLRLAGFAGLNRFLTPSEHGQPAVSVDPLEIAGMILLGFNRTNV
jgi:hypothetical protein